MKILRGFLVMFLILTIIGGSGYIIWKTVLSPMNHIGMGNTQHTQSPNTVKQNSQGNISQNNTLANTTAIQNRDKLNQSINIINQAIDLISIDPYSKTTLPQANYGGIRKNSMQGKSGQGNGTINIYPSGNSSVNLAPNGNNAPNNQTNSANTNQEDTNMEQNQSYVFDQSKLEQLHKGIFTLAQGVMMINQLNDDLLIQSGIVETTPPNYAIYVTRYNTALQNKTKLNNAVNLLNQASILINVNPYASPDGYPYNKDAMAQLHQGVYKLAQGMAGLSRLNEDFTSQMLQSSIAVQNILNSQTSVIDHGATSLQGLFGNISLPTLFNIIIIMLIIGLIIGVLGAVMNMLNRNNKIEHAQDNKGEENGVSLKE